MPSSSFASFVYLYVLSTTGPCKCAFNHLWHAPQLLFARRLSNLFSHPCHCSWPSVGGRLVAMRILAAGSFVAVVYLIASWWRHRCSVPTRRNGIRITSKGSAELLHLSDGMDGSASSIPTGSDFSPPLISAGTPLKRTVGWAAAARPGGAVATQAGESSSARMHTQPWAGHDPAAGSAGSSGSAADAGLQRQRSHSNLNRLGRSRTFSRRSLAAASPDGEWLNSVVTS